MPDVNDPDVQQRVLGLQHNFMAKGMGANDALKAGYKSPDFMIYKQASVQSYMDAFLYLRIMFLICVPFVLLVKGNKKQTIDLAEAMH